ncbi:SERCA-type calcium-translocating P-type ATPase [Thamnidium elegans]|nr:SERCA-type calcium-translocating P-type ATPase [Thamnidium elegans]
MENSFVKTPQEVCSYFGVDQEFGLTKEQALTAQEKYGKNELPKEKATPFWRLVLAQFNDTLVLILLAAAAISFILAVADQGDSLSAFVEPLVILLILIANAVVGVLQESSAEKAIDALRQYTPEETKVVRNEGTLYKISTVSLVPGDIIYITAGDKIPADARIVEIYSSVFRIDQSILTGESVSVCKSVGVVDDKKAVKQDQVNMLFSGTGCVFGKARAVVVATGVHTSLGHIHSSITNQISERTPLKRKLDNFGDMLAKVITVICVLVWLINIRHFNDESHKSWAQGAIYYFKIAVALAVAAIPEGLAAVITACLALGTKKMAKRGAIVRSLPSVETLGCTSVICSDKTGTLTTNQMCVSRVAFIKSGNGQMNELHVEGNTYDPIGTVKLSGQVYPFASYKSRTVKELAAVCSLCNDARITYNSASDKYQNVGEPTEAALKTLVEKLGTNDSAVNNILDSFTSAQRASACDDYFKSEYEKLATLEFTRERKSMSVVVSDAEGKKSLLVKGAPESILERCTMVRIGDSSKPAPLTEEMRKNINDKLRDYGKMALRCIAVAKIEEIDLESMDLKDQARFVQYETNMVFVGLVGMMDPPREEVKESIFNCKTAGIRVIVITGDNKNTAESICRQIGVFGEDEDVTGKSFTGREFDALSKLEKITAVQNASLFTRTEPAHKQELVDLLQSLGEIVAMTGDGVNDAPALKKADIGIAMGSGTDVAKLAADMVLSDDNFATIEKAVEEGRAIYNNTKQFIRYLISSNIGEVVSIFLTVLLGLPEALIPVQLLWVNLVTDGLPATALGFNLPDSDIMRKPPRKASDPLISKWLFVRYMIIGLYVGCATVFGYAWWYMYFDNGPQITFYQLSNYKKCAELFPEIGCEMFTNEMSLKATTMSLSILVLIEMLNAMNSISENTSLTMLPASSNPYLVAAVVLSMGLHFMILHVPFFANIFSVVPLTLEEWVGVLHVAAPIALVDEVLKLISRRYIDPPSHVEELGDIIVYDFRKKEVRKEE